MDVAALAPLTDQERLSAPLFFNIAHLRAAALEAASTLPATALHCLYFSFVAGGGTGNDASDM
jgi:hypothetical protein